MRRVKKEIFNCAICENTDFINEAPAGDVRKICLVCAINLAAKQEQSGLFRQQADVPAWAWNIKPTIPALKKSSQVRELCLA